MWRTVVASAVTVAVVVDVAPLCCRDVGAVGRTAETATAVSIGWPVAAVAAAGFDDDDGLDQECRPMWKRLRRRMAPLVAAIKTTSAAASSAAGDCARQWQR